MREERKDSVTPLKYPYILPILGDRVAKKGFQLPFPFGVMFNTVYAQQKLKLSDLEVGFNDSPMIPLDSIIKIDDMTANTVTLNSRIDAWILPFWDFYVLGGYAWSSNDLTISEPFVLNTNTSSEGYYFGVGSTIAFGIRNFFASGDASYVWSYQNLLDKPAKVLTAGLRAGPVFHFKKHKQMNVVLWTGGLYTNLNSETVGAISFTEVFPNADESAAELQAKLDDWYNNLTPVKQDLFEEIYNDISNGLDDVVENIDNSTIRYSMQKSIERPFNLIIGGQYQYNLRWQFRGEAQILGDRFGGLISVNYRFGLKGKNLLSAE
jgi:hypothetical protein